MGSAFPAGLHRHPHGPHAVHLPLGNGIGLKTPVFGVQPGALRGVFGLAPHAELLEASPVPNLCVAQELHVALVVHDALCPRVEIGRVADPVALQPEVGVEVERERSFAVHQVLHDDPAHEDRTVEVHRVGADQLHAQPRVPKPDVGDQRVVGVVQVARPLVVADPGKLTVHADAKSAGTPAGLVFRADPRVVDVAHAVARVEIDEQRSIAQGKVARHGVISRESWRRTHCRSCGPGRAALTPVLAAP